MRILIFIALMLYTGCASTMPFEGEVLRDVVGQKQSGAACRCEAVCQ
jgi:hypothetical protein